ncbi:MAG: hypothetical protein ABII12_03130 [Planctomycetota bacterium]
MRVDICAAPPPLAFGEGDERFSLRLKHVGSVERMEVLSACGGNDLAEVQHVINRLVIGWQGVEDPNGLAIPFDALDKDGKKVCNLDAFLGSLPIATQVSVIGSVLAFLGIKESVTQGLVERLSGTTGETIVTDPTVPPAGGTRTNASTGSST